MSQTTLFLASPCRSFPFQDYPELDAANAATAAEDIEPMRARVAAAFGVPADEICVSLADFWGMAKWKFSLDLDGECYEWHPDPQWFHAYGYGDGKNGRLTLFLPCDVTPCQYARDLNWSRIHRFLFFMGYDVEGITYHERLEWMLQQRELNGEKTDD